MTDNSQDGFNELADTRYGKVLYNKNDIYVGRSIKEYGEYSESEVEIFRAILKPGDVAMDVGANMGTHTLAMARLVGKYGYVIAFEPQAIVFQTLCANMALNSIENADCVNAIVSSVNGYSKLPRFDYTKEGNFGGISVKEYNIGGQIPCVTLDNAFPNPGKLSLIKIDVEGMELEVIIGASNIINRIKPTLYVENDKLEKSEALISAILDMGYNVYWHIAPLFNKNNFYGNKNDVFEGVSSFNMLCIHKSVKQEIKGFQKVEDKSYHPLREWWGDKND